MTTSEAVLIAAAMETRVRAWNPANMIGGYIRVGDIVSIALGARYSPIHLEWTGDGTYPLHLEHSSFNDGKMRPALVYWKDSPITMFMNPMSDGTTYRVTWYAVDGTRYTNTVDVTCGATADTLDIENDTVTLCNLNYLDNKYIMVLI